MSQDRTFCSRVQDVPHFAEIPRLLYALIFRGLYVGWEPAILTFPRDRQLETTSFSSMRKAISQKVSVGEQPRGSDLEELKKDGVTTVVNLRVAGEDTALAPTEERVLAEKLGLQYHQLPISLDKLNAAQVKELREILEHSQGQVFVHCGLGQRACSLSLAASGVAADSIFEQAGKLGFPVQDEKLRGFLKILKE